MPSPTRKKAAQTQTSNTKDWEDPVHVTLHYKTEICQKNLRICDYTTCPNYHTKKERRRPFGSCQYTSAACELVKVGEEWKEPTNCPRKDDCPKCHTRMEQQFHPEVYKKMQCKDLGLASGCPRGLFCAFAHNDQEQQGKRCPDWEFDWKTILPDGVLPQYHYTNKSLNHNHCKKPQPASVPASPRQPNSDEYNVDPKEDIKRPMSFSAAVTSSTSATTSFEEYLLSPRGSSSILSTPRSTSLEVPLSPELEPPTRSQGTSPLALSEIADSELSHHFANIITIPLEEYTQKYTVTDDDCEILMAALDNFRRIKLHLSEENKVEKVEEITACESDDKTDSTILPSPTTDAVLTIDSPSKVFIKSYAEIASRNVD